MAAKKGRFDWYDLMASDVAAAKSFYTKVIGWKTTKWSQGGDYEMWTVGDQAIGGMMALPDEAKKAGAPQHWMAFIETDDIQATAKKAEQLGGRVRRPPTDIPTVGKFAILTDPQGVDFAAFQPLNAMNDAPHKPGYFSWHELNTTDAESASRFYSELFGWKNTSSMDMGPEMGKYWMFGLDAQNAMGGMSNVAKVHKVPPHWLYYVSVEDIDATVASIKANGGKVLNGPMEVPGGDKIAQAMDPQGGMFAVHMAKK
jgi:predicted enzyme related to lactoylglutathione lyase